MDFGINLATSADSWKVVKRAEELGYARAWFYDTQLLNADMFVAMGAAAVQTSRIRLATGVLIPSNRIAPVAASALASLNALRARPHRLRHLHRLHRPPHHGAGAGQAGRHATSTSASCSGCSRARRWSGTFEGKRRKIRFLNPEIGVGQHATTRSRCTSRRSARAAARLTAELGAGWLYATGHIGRGQGRGRRTCRRPGAQPASTRPTGWPRRSPAAACSRTARPFDSPRGRAQAGPHATIALHNLVEVEEFGNMGRSVPPALAPLLERYREIYRAYEPADARYLANHRGHLMFLRPEEHEVCTADLIRTMTFTGTRPALQRAASASCARPGTITSRSASATAIPRCWRSGRTCSQGV